MCKSIYLWGADSSKTKVTKNQRRFKNVQRRWNAFASVYEVQMLRNITSFVEKKGEEDNTNQARVNEELSEDEGDQLGDN